jgi:flagellar protein FlaG
MADLNVIPPSSLNSLITTKPDGALASEEKSRTKEAEVSQSVEQTNKELERPKSEEVNDQQEQVELASLMEDLNIQLEQLQNYLKFEKDESSEKVVIFIKNSETDEVIRQIPSQEFLTISKNISNFIEMRQQLSNEIVTPPGLITHEQA